MEDLFLFIHSEWTDFCLIHFEDSIIKRKNIENEIGKYIINNDEIIINWNNWEGDDIFIKFNLIYYHKDFYINYIHNYKLNYYKLYDNNLYCNYVLNITKKIIFKKYDINCIGNYELILNNFLIIKWKNESKNQTFINLNENFYEQKFLINLIKNNTDNINNNDKTFDDYINNINMKNILLKKNRKIEKFKKIDNKYYLDKNNISVDIVDNIIPNQINNNIIPLNEIKSYCYNNIDIDFKIRFQKIKDNINNLLKNNTKLNNIDYLNIKNLENYVNKEFNNDDNILYNFSKLNLNFEISNKIKKRNLTLVEWAYPPFGGGENWLLDFNKILFNNNYDNYIIYFSIPFKNIYFNEIKLIDLKYVKIIQMPKEIFSIINIIKKINPDFIHHQGVNRDFFMKISNILEIPFLTGFCFWQNIIKFNMDNINIDMLSNNNLEKTEEFDTILKNSYTYASSQFVNDVIKKIYNKEIDIIETISLKDDFYIDNINLNENKYLTLINCHYNKGGYLLDYLCKNLNINIPILLVYTENDPIISFDFISKLINERNLKNNINIIINEKIDIKLIYKKTRILLIPSLCDETFCRVGYEAMINKIPIISSMSGNLKYLLKDYAIFIENKDPINWNNVIEKYYYDNSLFDLFINKKDNYLTYEYIENKILNKINSIHDSKYKLNDKNIGIIIPWADQGLGIQGREYYITLKNIGYTPFIFSFKPYHATYDNILLQTNKEEWFYENVYYSKNYREDITYDEIFDFVYKNNIKKIIIIEASFIHIFKIALFLKLLNVKIYVVINIECIRLIELLYHDVFDLILTNNVESNIIISNIFENKTKYLGFHLEHHYFKNIIKNINKKKNILKFFCSGGLNSISRKNIDLIIITFFNLFHENKYINWELNVYIQGVEIPEIIKKYNCINIKYHIYNFSYKSVIKQYNKNDIFIHLGSHEGLGLGFYESLYCGTPVITLNWTPNNEIIKNNINGWLIDCCYSDIDNNSLINKANTNELNLKNKIIQILEEKDNTFKIINDTINNRKNIYNTFKNKFHQNLLSFL